MGSRLTIVLIILYSDYMITITISKPISERVYNADQSWYFERTVTATKNAKKVKLQVNIRRNAYNDQSYARVKRWSGTEWKNVVDAPITECECKSITYVDRLPATGLFKDDADRLLQEAIQIVF